MTERPEERDSLAEIENRHASRTLEGSQGYVICREDEQNWPCDARTLINEVKELREEMADDPEMLTGAADMIEQQASRIKQMEEGLREIAEAEVDWTQGVDENFTRLQVIAERLIPSE